MHRYCTNKDTSNRLYESWIAVVISVASGMESIVYMVEQQLAKFRWNNDWKTLEAKTTGQLTIKRRLDNYKADVLEFPFLSLHISFFPLPLVNAFSIIPLITNLFIQHSSFILSDIVFPQFSLCT